MSSTITYARINRKIARGEKIEDVREIIKIARENKTIVAQLGDTYMVKPAAAILNWSFRQFCNATFYHFIKLNP